MAAATAALGAGVGAAFATLAALIAENVRATETGVATGVNTVVRMIGAVVGGQIAAALLTVADDRADVDPRRVCVHDGLHAERGGGVRGAFIALSIVPSPAPRLEPVEVFD